MTFAFLSYSVAYSIKVPRLSSYLQRLLFLLAKPIGSYSQEQEPLKISVTSLARVKAAHILVDAKLTVTQLLLLLGEMSLLKKKVLKRASYILILILLRFMKLENPYPFKTINESFSTHLPWTKNPA
jgi:hypothetical protein